MAPQVHRIDGLLRAMTTGNFRIAHELLMPHLQARLAEFKLSLLPGALTVEDRGILYRGHVILSEATLEPINFAQLSCAEILDAIVGQMSLELLGQVAEAPIVRLFQEHIREAMQRRPVDEFRDQLMGNFNSKGDICGEKD